MLVFWYRDSELLDLGSTVDLLTERGILQSWNYWVRCVTSLMVKWCELCWQEGKRWGGSSDPIRRKRGQSPPALLIRSTETVVEQKEGDRAQVEDGPPFANTDRRVAGRPGRAATATKTKQSKDLRPNCILRISQSFQDGEKSRTRGCEAPIPITEPSSKPNDRHH